MPPLKILPLIFCKIKKRGSYAHFAGRDASRAFATGCFKEHLTHDLRGLSKKQLEIIDHWVEFFDKNKKYKHVGKLILPYIDPESAVPQMCEKPMASIID